MDPFGDDGAFAPPVHLVVAANRYCTAGVLARRNSRAHVSGRQLAIAMREAHECNLT